MPALPDKLYYSIREVADFTGVEPHVLRYWESEFPSLKPRRSRSGSRTYRRKDIDEILVIRKLLHEEGYRISGARKMLRTARDAAVEAPAQMAISFDALDPADQLREVKRELLEIQELLRDRGGERTGD